MNKVAPYNLRLLQVEGMEIFDLSKKELVFSKVNHTFKSLPIYISASDEKENPSKRMAEFKPGAFTGMIKAPGRQRKEYTDYKYFAWDLPEGEIQSFVKYANYGDPLKECEDLFVQSGFLIENTDDNEIAEISKKVEWISATADISESANNLKLYIRIKYVPPNSDVEVRRSKDILEKAVELYFLELKGFSHESSHCILPSIPKIVSLSVLCNDDFMGMIVKEFEKSSIKGGFALNDEIRKVLSLLGYGDAGYPSVINESKNLFHFIWQGGLSKDGRSYYIVDFTNLEKFINERLKHSLPVEAITIRGTTDLISDILSYISFWFSSLKFYQERNLDVSKKQYMSYYSYLIKYFDSLTTKKYNEIFLNLVKIQANLQTFQTELDAIFERLPGFSPFLLRLYSPEVAVAQLNIFDIANLREDERENMPLTFSQSLDLLRKRVNRDMNAILIKQMESVEKTITLINSRIQMKETRMNTYLIALTVILVLVAIIGLFGLKL